MGYKVSENEGIPVIVAFFSPVQNKKGEDRFT